MGDSGDILDIKIADLRATAPKFENEGIALGKALRKLQTALSVAGEAWGDDKQGEEFHEAYGPHVKQVERSTQILIDGLASIHLAMSDMADGRIDHEELVRAMFSRIRIDHGTESDGK